MFWLCPYRLPAALSFSNHVPAIDVAALLAALMLGVYVAAITEGFSAFHAVTRAAIAIARAAVCVVAVIALWKLKPQQKLETATHGS